MHVIDRQHLEGMLADEDADFLLINVLSAEEFNRRHLRNSINVPLKTPRFAELVAEIAGNKDRRIVVYCASFDCDASTKAATELEAEGFTDVYDYEGGTQHWFDHKSAA